MQNNIKPTIFYCNPNIYPETEYFTRKDECLRYAKALGLEVVDAGYDHEEWKNFVEGFENEPERGARCLECFKMRLRKAAEYAHAHDYEVVTTTLASSRWKSLQQISVAGDDAVAPYEDLIFWDQNWRKGGLQERRLSIIKEYGFYNQQYCGCEYSMRKQDMLDNKENL